MSNAAGEFLKFIETHCWHILVKFSGKKTEALHFFRPGERVEDFPIVIDEERVLSTLPELGKDSVRVLGFWLDNKLSWLPHLKKQATKCMKAMWAVKRGYGSSWGLLGSSCGKFTRD